MLKLRVQKVIAAAFFCIFTASFVLFSLSAALSAVINCRAFYNYSFREFGVSLATGLDPAQLDLAARGIIAYFNSDQDYIDVRVLKDGAPFELFNPKEQIHLRDVQGLVHLNYSVLLFTTLFIGAGAVFLVLRRHSRILGKLMCWSGAVALGLLLALGVVALADFNALFVQFHLLSFSNDFWILDPATDYLIRLFPEEFFAHSAVLAGLGVAVLGLAGFGAGRLIMRNTQ